MGAVGREAFADEQAFIAYQRHLASLARAERLKRAQAYLTPKEREALQRHKALQRRLLVERPRERARMRMSREEYPDRWREYRRRDHLKHRAARLAYKRAFWWAHRDELLIKHAIWYQDHRDERRVYNQQYREAHRDELIAYDRERRSANPLLYRQRARRSYANHRQARVAAKTVYRDNNRDAVHEAIRKYRATHKNEIRAMQRLYHQCHRNHISMVKAQYRLDHLDETKARNHRYHMANRDAITARKREHRAARPGYLSQEERSAQARAFEQQLIELRREGWAWCEISEITGHSLASCDGTYRKAMKRQQQNSEGAL